MIILAFSTSTDHGSVALLRKGNVLAQLKWSRKPNQMQNSDALILKIDSLLKKTKMTAAKISAVAVDKGPGSFTGCRIAVNVAKTFGFTLNIPVIDVSSLDALAHALPKAKLKGPFLTVLDAHKSLAYCRWYEILDNEVLPRSTIEARSLDLLVSQMTKGTIVSGICPKSFDDAFAKAGAKIQVAYPEAKFIGILAIGILNQKTFSAETWRDVEPSYVRSPDAVEKLLQK